MGVSLGDSKRHQSEWFSVCAGAQLPGSPPSPFCHFLAVGLAKLLNLSEPLFSHIQNENDFSV